MVGRVCRLRCARQRARVLDRHQPGPRSGPAAGGGRGQQRGLDPLGHRPARSGRHHGTAAPGAGRLPDPGQRRPAQRARPGARRLDRLRPGPGGPGGPRSRGGAGRRPVAHRGLVHHHVPGRAGGPRGGLGYHAEGGQGATARGAGTRARLRRTEIPRRLARPRSHTAGPLQLHRTVRPCRRRRRSVPRGARRAGAGGEPGGGAHPRPGHRRSGQPRVPGADLVVLGEPAPGGDRPGARCRHGRRAARDRGALRRAGRGRPYALGLPARPADPAGGGPAGR